MAEIGVERGDGWLQKALHDLCQPLTALQCRLFLGTMTPAGGPQEELAELRSAVRESLVQCDRMMTHVRIMQIGLGNRGELDERSDVMESRAAEGDGADSGSGEFGYRGARTTEAEADRAAVDGA